MPFLDFSGVMEDVAWRTTLAGIDVHDDEACPWIDERVLLVFSTYVYVDPSGPVLVTDGREIAVGDEFETNPLIELEGSFTCAGERWPDAVQLSDAPLLPPQGG